MLSAYSLITNMGHFNSLHFVQLEIHLIQALTEHAVFLALFCDNSMNDLGVWALNVEIYPCIKCPCEKKRKIPSWFVMLPSAMTHRGELMVAITNSTPAAWSARETGI